MPDENERFSVKSICAVIDSVEVDFVSCLETVFALEGRMSIDDLGQSIVDFQPKMFDAISRLDSKYRAVVREEKRLVSKKQHLNRSWFKCRMGRLADYRKALREAILVGKSIGDGFAWYFYERDRDLITEHLNHDFHSLLPPGYGRIGERKCLDVFRYMDGHFQLYHGITTFLRLGDCSFVNLSTMRISAIGEVKTKRKDEETLASSLSLVFAKDEMLPNFNSFKPNKNLVPEKFDQKIEQRRKRQVKQMVKAVSGENSIKADNNVNARDMEFSFTAVDEAVTKCKLRNFSVKKVSDGLMVCAFRLRKKNKLSSALISQSKKTSVNDFGNFSEEAIRIMVEDRKDNSLRIGSIGFAKENLINRSDRLPFVLWPLSNKTISDVMFGSALVFVLFNPLPLKLSLEKRGYKVQVREDYLPISATKTVDDCEIGVHNLSYFIDLILHGGMSENDILQIIDQSLELAWEQRNGRNLKMNIVPRILKHRDE